MDKRVMYAVVKEDLEHVWRLSRGFDQNIFRAAYSSARQQQLSEGIDDRVQSLLVAAESCRDQSIKTPTFDASYFGITRKELLRRIMRYLRIDQSIKPPDEMVQCPREENNWVEVNSNCFPVRKKNFDPMKVDRSFCGYCDGVHPDPNNRSIKCVRCSYPNPIYRGTRLFRTSDRPTD